MIDFWTVHAVQIPYLRLVRYPTKPRECVVFDPDPFPAAHVWKIHEIPRFPEKYPTKDDPYDEKDKKYTQHVCVLCHGG